MKCKTILLAIKDQLQNTGALLLSQREFLISAVELIESGEPLETAFTLAELPSRPRGKSSAEYQAAKRKRNAWLTAAVDCFDGTEWHRCDKVAAVCATAWRQHRAGQFTATTDAEHLVKRILDAGFKPPMTQQGVQAAINTQKSNLLNH